MNTPPWGTWLRAVALSLLAAPAVHAADSTAPGFELSRFEPAGRGSRFFGLETLDWRQGPTLGLVADYAYKPLVIYEVNDANQREVATVAKHFALGSLGGTWSPIAQLRLGADLPVLLYGDGSPGQIGLVSYAAPRRTGVGDLRLMADWRFWGAATDRFRAALGVKLFLPTGDPTAYSGEGTLRGTVQVQGAGEALPWLSWSARLGLHLKGTDTTFAGGQIGSEAQLGLALGARAFDGRLTVGPELNAATTLKSAFSAPSTSVDLLFGAHFDVTSQWRVGLAFGRGATVALGSPSFRGLLNVEWVPAAGESCQSCQDQLAAARRELEAQRAAQAQAAAEARAAKDASDAEEARRQAKARADAEAAAAAAEHAAADDDGDGVANGVDACPEQVGFVSGDAARSGCPTGALVDGQLVLDLVRFRTNSDVILPESDAILEKVLAAMTQLPAEYRYRVEGHTDDRGPAAFNTDLSQRRAKSVVAWLVAHGLDAKRFEATGLGPSRPVSPNDSDAHRQLNRRVEIHITNLEGR